MPQPKPTGIRLGLAEIFAQTSLLLMELCVIRSGICSVESLPLGLAVRFHVSLGLLLIDFVCCLLLLSCNLLPRFAVVQLLLARVAALSRFVVLLLYFIPWHLPTCMHRLIPAVT